MRTRTPSVNLAAIGKLKNLIDVKSSAVPASQRIPLSPAFAFRRHEPRRPGWPTGFLVSNRSPAVPPLRPTSMRASTRACVSWNDLQETGNRRPADDGPGEMTIADD